MSDPLIGTTVGGCEILEVIGQGGMGIIYKGLQKSLDRVVALKVLAPKFTDDINFISRFQREARAIAKVNHQNILGVYDVGSNDRTHFMIMELIEGESLSELQEAKAGPLDLEQAIDFVTQSAQGLEAAQAVGVTHRDIKPENLMVTQKGIIKVSDFGLAKEADAGATSTDAVMGTPAFMSPEQCDGKKVDGRTDIYSLGASFYKLITGRLPFEAETAMSMMYRHKHEALVPPKEILPAIPSSISSIIVKMMEKKRERRYQNMTEVIAALHAASKEATAGDLEIHLPFPGGVPRPASNQAPVHVDGLRGAVPPGAPLPGGQNSVSSRRYGLPPPGRSGRTEGPQGRRLSDRLEAITMGPGSTPRGGSSRSADIFGLQTASTSLQLISRGDQMLAQGDRLAGLKCYREALKAGGLEDLVRERVEGEIAKEVTTRRQAGETLIKRGLMVEASREFRLLLELAPKDDLIRAQLKHLEMKLADRRTIVNDIRSAVAALKFEEALRLWDATPHELRDESLSKQIDHIRKVVAPSLKLCEKAEQYAEQGRLEEALATFRDAIHIDENCERARQGLRDTEAKLHRIDSLLREGYEHNLKQDFERAIDAWKPILRLQPGHPQATKSMIDAYGVMSQTKRAQGDLTAALNALSGAQQAAPENMTIKKQFEELVEIRDKELALLDRARDATARGRQGEALRYWDEVVRINPANKLALTAMAELKKKRAISLTKSGTIAAVVLGGLGFGYLFLSETIALSNIKTFLQQERAQQALSEIDKTFWIIYKQEAAELEGQAKLQYFEQGARLHEANGDRQKAADWLQSATEFTLDKRRISSLTVKRFELLTEHEQLKGEEAIRKQDWRKALEAFNKSAKIAATSETEGRLSEQSIAIGKALKFIEAVEAGNGNLETNKALALRYFKNAQALRPDNEYVKKMLTEQGYSPEEFDRFFHQAIKAMNEPWRPEALQDAEQALISASKADVGHIRLPPLKQLLSDMKECETAGMVLVTFSKLDQDQLQWNQSERKNAFCIDRYEYPNKAGQAPLAGVSWLVATDTCKKEGKRLCTTNEWQKGCKAKAYAGIWTTGNTLDADACNWSGQAAAPSGSFSKCHNTIGAFDMSGNLSEWTSDTAEDGKAYAAGGSFASGPDNAKCLDKLFVSIALGNNQTGFRCCRALAGE